MALLGLAMIGFSIIAYSVDTPFPGATALVPCFGAALIIAAGQAGESRWLDACFFAAASRRLSD